MSDRSFKNQIYREFARVGAALASDRRLELLDLLAQGPRHVEALAAEANLSVANASQHLQILRRARLVETERSRTKVLYRLADRNVLDLWLALRSVAESRLAEIGQITREFGVDDVDGADLPRDQVERLVKRGDAVLIDVRPRLEYESGHLPGAICIPLEELPERVDELPRGRRIVAYCRGEYCLLADEAIALLRERGFEAQRLEGGWPEWLAEGRPVG